MSVEVTRRVASPEERAEARRMLSVAPTTARRLKDTAEEALVLWAVSLLCLMVAYFFVGWIAGKIWDIHLGLTSQVTVWVMAIATPACFVIAVVSSIRSARQRPDDRVALRRDVHEAQVNEERYVFAEAKCFQEPERGGLLYMLRCSEHDAFAFYDQEALMLALNDQDPFKSSFRPRTELTVVRALHTALPLSMTWSGDPLDAGKPISVCEGPDRWPEGDTLSKIPWSELEQTLG